MKKFLIVAAIVLSCAVTVVPRASAQSAMFTYTGIPAGPLGQNVNFTIGINVVFTSGGTINNINGLSYWIAQNSGTGFPIMLTVRNIGASPFTDFQTNDFNLALPHIINPINTHPSGPNPTFNTDLGALSAAPMISGTYFVGSLTFNTGSGSGVYTLGNTTASTPGVGGRISIVNDSDGDTFPITSSPFNITVVVPEPSSVALLCVGLISAGGLAYRRRAAARR